MKHMTRTALFLTAALGSSGAMSAHAENPSARAGYHWLCNHFLASGIATHYDKKLDGNPTSSGEIFRNAKLTAASLDTSLVPFSRNPKKPIYVMVTRGSKSIMVRMNDLGAYHGGTNETRIIDLSWAGKVALGAFDHNPDVKTYLCKQEKIPVPMMKPASMVIATSTYSETTIKEFLADKLTANLSAEFNAPFPGYREHYEAVFGRMIPPSPAQKTSAMIVATGGSIQPSPTISNEDFNVLVATGFISPPAKPLSALAFTR